MEQDGLHRTVMYREQGRMADIDATDALHDRTELGEIDRGSVGSGTDVSEVSRVGEFMQRPIKGQRCRSRYPPGCLVPVVLTRALRDRRGTSRHMKLLSSFATATCHATQGRRAFPAQGDHKTARCGHAL
ncbi:hypothetical protein MPS_0225 [Mycobacterium pseudoshottsii JCM 15466]|nr:hypothetical protein MPS_0225 [Mycobacterium pseudoshottsii JCM 15466]